MDKQTAKLCGEMLDLITGHWKAAMIACAARLGIADHLHGKTLSAEELAKLTDAHAPSLYRLLRALCDLNLFHEDQQKKFSLTPLGATLRDDVFRYMAIAVAHHSFEPWSNLLHSIKTGESGFQDKYGIHFYQHLENMAKSQNNEEFDHFRRALLECSKAFCFHIPHYYDFTQFKHIVDLGGNDGTFLSEVLKYAPNAKGTVYDGPGPIHEAKQKAVALGLSDRMHCVVGSFIDSVPAGADCYMMKVVLVDWIGEQAQKILRNIREQLQSGKGKLLIIQSVIPEPNVPHMGKFFDLNYLLFTKGEERTKEEFEKELSKAGFRVNKIIHADHPIFTIVECVPV